MLTNKGWNDIIGTTYDAYGNHKILLDTNGIGTLNPIRYRGYYYDVETGLYYIAKRYYDPETGRFISPKEISSLSPTSINGINAYIYGNNNPISNVYCSSSNIKNDIVRVSYSPEVTNSLNIFNNVLLNGSFSNGLFFGKGSITGLYTSGNIRAQISLKNGKFVLGAFGKFSLLNATGQIGIGNEDFSVSLVGVADLGTVSGMAGILIDPKKNTYFAGIEAKASVFSARGGVQFDIFGNQIEVGGSVSALSAGFQYGIGVKDGEFYFKSGVAVLFGFDFYVRIKFA